MIVSIIINLIVLLSFDNLLLALTNFIAYYPIKTSFANNDIITAMVILFVAIMSFLSHLFESHRHDMIGFGAPKQLSYLLNRLDVFACFLVITRYIYLLLMNLIKFPNIFEIIGILIAIIFNIISENDKNSKWPYFPLHCMWHISIFCMMNSILQ
jgi:hypothetical protein